MAWAFCRMARQYDNLGEALRAAFTDATIPTTLDNCKLNARIFGGHSASVDENNFMTIFKRMSDKSELWDFADHNAGLDGCTFFMNMTGFLSLQSKVRVSFDIVDALTGTVMSIIYLYSTNPFLAYLTKLERRQLVANHWKPTRQQQSSQEQEQSSQEQEQSSQKQEQSSQDPREWR